MKKGVLVGGVLGGLLIGVELLVGELGPEGNRSTDEVWVERGGLLTLAPERDVWVASSRLETDSDGQRAALASAGEGEFSVLIAGGHFSAGLGTDDEVHFAAALRRELVDSFGVEDPVVRLWIARGDVGGRCERILELARADPPSCVILQFQPADFGADSTAFVASGTTASWDGPLDGPGALVRAASHWRERRDRRVIEHQVAERVAVDGLCSRASELARQRFLEFQERRERDPDGGPRFRAQLREIFDPRRRAARDAARAHIESCLEQLQAMGCRPMVMLVGTDELLGAASEAVLALGLPQVAGPPDHLDPELVVGSPPRPADVVHARWGQCLAAALEDVGYLPVGIESPDPDRHREAVEVFREIRSFHGRHEGHQLEVLREVLASVPSELGFEGSPGPWVFAGVGPDGAVTAATVRCVMRARGPASSLQVEVESAPSPPDLEVLWGDQVGGPASAWEPVGPGTWRAQVEAPAASRGNQTVEVALRWSGPVEGLRLRRCRFRPAGEEEGA